LANQTSPAKQQTSFWASTSGLVAKDRGEHGARLLGLVAGLIQWSNELKITARKRFERTKIMKMSMSRL